MTHDPSRGFLMGLKGNLGHASNLSFRFGQQTLEGGIEAPTLTFDPDPVDLLPSDVASPEKAQQKTEREEAKEFLREALANGARPSKDVQREAAQLDISRTTLKRAGREIGIERKKLGMKEGWAMKLPDEILGLLRRRWPQARRRPHRIGGLLRRVWPPSSGRPTTPLSRPVVRGAGPASLNENQEAFQVNFLGWRSDHAQD